ncbi:hypothetical protein [Falsibacillus pallidus]|uniref:Uncharacterized protein n=1 Tax=Falsibacillus pallidus TaxID=493781 RepID=A0A370GP71_9BACI|nr:hypothetical protein [Falsibacillus pallidus]RDI45535.1 hypothetical protein DFR59_102163 [Falsibacillus pallidus]
MRRVSGISSLVDYLHSVNYPLSEHEINELIQKKQLPHFKPMKNLLVFNLDHIDWWIEDQREYNP